MKLIINELQLGNIIPQEDSRNNTKEMKELLSYMSRHEKDLEKSFTDEHKETFEKLHDCWSKYMSLAGVAIFEYAFKEIYPKMQDSPLICVPKKVYNLKMSQCFETC